MSGLATEFEIQDILIVEVKIGKFCKFCDKFFTNTANLNRHVIQVHISPHNFQCAVCNHWFKTIPNLYRHVKFVHLNLKILKLQCPKCNKGFAFLSGLTRHMGRRRSCTF